MQVNQPLPTPPVAEMRAMVLKAARRVARYVDRDTLTEAEQAAAKIHMSALHALGQALNAVVNAESPSDLLARVEALERTGHARVGTAATPRRTVGGRAHRR